MFKQGIFSNFPLIVAIMLAALLQLAILYVPFLQHIFATEPLSWAELGKCVLAALLVFHVVEAEKLIRNKFLTHKK